MTGGATYVVFDYFGVTLMFLIFLKTYLIPKNFSHIFRKSIKFATKRAKAASQEMNFRGSKLKNTKKNYF
jgi:hypothetical protein